MQIQPVCYNISDLYEWYQKGTLILQPKFQRREVWTKMARSYLIDTILRGLPVPKLYIRQIIDLDTGRSIREVVDGQQRLKAAFDFLGGELKVYRIHNDKYGDLKFEELPETVRTNFLAYQFSADMLLGALDREVLDIFTRINSYTITLNAQEKINAKFSGVFKQIVYNLGWDHLEFWRKNRILTDRKITRMGEAELASELVVAMLDGLQDGKESLKHFYEKYEQEFPNAAEIVKKFHEMIDIIAFIFGDKLFDTPFRRVPFFYSLFCVLYDCKYGLPKMNLGLVPINKKTREPILKALIEIGKEMIADEPKPQYMDLHSAYLRSTDKIKERGIRHKYFWNAIQSAVKPNQPDSGLTSDRTIK